MERLRWEKERAVAQAYGLVSGHGREDVNDADEFWEEGEEERRRGPKKPSAAERQSQLMALSLTQLLSVSFQEKAQSLQQRELDAFLHGTLKESASFSTASPSDLASAVDYLKQVLGTLHGLDVSPPSDVQAQADQGAPLGTTAPASPGDAGRTAPAAEPGEAIKQHSSAHGSAYGGAHGADPMQNAGAQPQDVSQAGSSFPSEMTTGSEPSLTPAHPDHLNQWQQQQQQQQQGSGGSLQNAASASFHLHSPDQASSAGQQQQQQQQQQGLGFPGHQTPGSWAPPVPYRPPAMQAGHPMDPYHAFLSAAASAASAAAAAFAGSWPRLPGSNPSVSPHCNFPPYSATASHHTSPSDPQALDAQWPQQPAQQQQQQQQQWPQHPQHKRSHRRGRKTNRNTSSIDRTGGGDGFGEGSRGRAGSGSGSGGSSLEGCSSPEPEPQALDARMASAAVHMMHGRGVSPAAAGVHMGAAKLHQQQHPVTSATAVRVVKHDEGPRIKARVPPSGPIELRPPHFQVFRNLQSPATGTEQTLPLPLPQQHPLPPPSPYSSPPISPPRSPPLPAVRPSPRARVAAQLTPTPAPSRARVPLPHHQPKITPTHSLPPPSHPSPAPNSGSEPWRSSPAAAPTYPTSSSNPPNDPATATYSPLHTHPSVPPHGHVPQGLHASSAPAMLRTHIAAPVSPQHAPTQHAALQGQYGSSLQYPDAQAQPPICGLAHPPAAVQAVRLPPQPPLPPRQPVPLPSELQGSVQRTLEFLENPLSFAPGAASDVGGTSYPPRVSFATAEQQAAQRALEEQLGGRFDYKLLVADLEAMHRRTQRLPASSAAATGAAAMGSSIAAAPVHAPQADRDRAGGLKDGTAHASSAAKAVANAQARGGAALGKLVQQGAQHAKGSQLAGAQPPAPQRPSHRPNAIDGPAVHTAVGSGTFGEGDIVEALPPSSSVWDSEEAWRDMDAYIQSIQQEVAYRASAPAPPPSKHTPTPQELDAAVAARLHRPHPSAARAAAAAASITAAGAAHTSRKSGKSEEEGGGGGAQQQQQQQRLQQRRRQQAKMEAGGAGEDHHSLPMSAGPSHSARLPSPPIRLRPAPPKIAFGRRADVPPLSSVTFGAGGLGARAPAAAAKDRALPVHGQRASPTHLTRTGAAAAAARHATHTTPPRGSPTHPTAPLFDSRTSTASKLSALLKAHAQHAQQNRRHHDNSTPSRHHTRHHTRPGHTHRVGIDGRHHRSHHNHHRRHKRRSSDSSSCSYSSSDSAASLNTSSYTGSGPSSSAVGGSGADLEDVLSVLASVLAEEEGPEAQEALMAEVLEALQAAGQGIPGLDLPGTGMADATGGGRGGSGEAQFRGSLSDQQQQGGPSLSQQQQQQQQQQRQGGSGWAATQELAQQLAALAAQQRQPQQQQQQQQQRRRGNGAQAGARAPLNEPLQPSQLPLHVPQMPRYVAVQDLSEPPSADSSHPPSYSPHLSSHQQPQQWGRTPQLLQQQHAQMIGRQQQQQQQQQHAQMIGRQQQQQQQGLTTPMPLFSMAHAQLRPQQQHQPWPVHSSPPPIHSSSPVLEQHQHQQQQPARPAVPPAPTRVPWQPSWAGDGITGEGADGDDGADGGDSAGAGAAAAVPATVPPPYTRSAAMLGLYGDAAQLGVTGHAPAHAGAATMLHDTAQGGVMDARTWHTGMPAEPEGMEGSPAEALLDLVVEEVAAQVAVRERLQGPSVLAAQQQQQQQQEVVRAMPLLTDPQVSRQLASEVVLEHLSKLLAPISTEEEQQREQQQQQQEQQQQQASGVLPLPATHATPAQPLSAPGSLQPHTEPPLAQAPTSLLAAPGPSLIPATACVTQPAVVSVSGAAGGVGSPGGGVAGAFYGGEDGPRGAATPTAYGGVGASSGGGGDGGHGGAEFYSPLAALEASGLEAREAGRAALAAAAAAAAAALPSPPKHYSLQGQGQAEQQQEGRQGQDRQQLEGWEQGQRQGQQQQGLQQEDQDRQQLEGREQGHGQVQEQQEGQSQQQLEDRDQGQVQGQQQGTPHVSVSAATSQPPPTSGDASAGAAAAAPTTSTVASNQGGCTPGGQGVQGAAPDPQPEGEVSQQGGAQAVPAPAPGAAAATGGDGQSANPLHRAPPPPFPGLTLTHEAWTEGKAGTAATEGTAREAVAEAAAGSAPAGQPVPLQQDQHPGMCAHAGPSTAALEIAAAPAPAPAAVHPSAAAAAGPAAAGGSPPQPQPLPPYPATGSAPILTMQVPIPIPTPYPAYYAPFSPSPAWPGFAPPTPHQQHQHQQQFTQQPGPYYLGGVAAGPPSQGHPLPAPSPSHPLHPAGVHSQEPPQHAQPPLPAWAARASRHAGGGVGGAAVAGRGGSAARGRLSSLLPGLERVLLDSSDLGSSGDSDALEGAVRAALGARTGHARAAGGGSAPDEADAADPLRLLRESYPEASLEALLAAVPRAQQGVSQAQAGEQLQHDPQQQQQRGEQQVAPDVPFLDPALSTGNQGQSVSAQEKEGTQEPGREKAHGSSGSGSRDGGASEAAAAAAAMQARQQGSSSGSRIGGTDEATAAAMQVTQLGSSSGSRGGVSEATGSSGDLGLEAVKLAGAMDQGDEEGEEDEEVGEVEGEGEEWKRLPPTSARGGVNLAKEEEQPQQQQQQQQQQHEDLGSSRSSRQSQGDVSSESRDSLAGQRQHEQTKPELPRLMPQAPTSHTSFPAGQAVPKSAARLPAQAAAAAAAPAGDCPEAQRLAEQGLSSMVQPSSQARPPAATISSPQEPPSSSINPPPAPPLQAVTGASIGLPPSLQDYSGPLRRLWRPNQGPAPPHPHQAAVTSAGPAVHPMQGYTKDGSARGLTGGGGDALDQTPPLHACSPPSSLQSSGEAFRFSSSDVTTASSSTNTATTSSSSTAGGLAAREPPRPVNTVPLAEGEPGHAPPLQQPHIPGASRSKNTGASYRVVMRRYGAKRREMMRQLGLIGDSLLASSRSTDKLSSEGSSSTSTSSGSSDNRGSSSGSDANQ